MLKYLSGPDVNRLIILIKTYSTILVGLLCHRQHHSLTTNTQTNTTHESIIASPRQCERPYLPNPGGRLCQQTEIEN